MPVFFKDGTQVVGRQIHLIGQAVDRNGLVIGLVDRRAHLVHQPCILSMNRCSSVRIACPAKSMMIASISIMVRH